MPIQLWDESRNVVNALEMQRSGLALVTTYDGAPDGHRIAGVGASEAEAIADLVAWLEDAAA